MSKHKNNYTRLYKHIGLFLLATVIAIIITSSEAFQSLLLQLTPVTFLAEIIAGGLYTSLLTIPISLSILSMLAEHGNLFYIAVVGGVGATIGDYVIMSTLQRAGSKLNLRSARWSRHQRNRLLRFTLTVAGAICLALPFPDEIALGILGITRPTTKMFILLVYPVKTLGLLTVLLSLQAIT